MLTGQPPLAIASNIWEPNDRHEETLGDMNELKPMAAGGAATNPRPVGLEILAVILLLVGSLAFGFGWLIGVALLWRSSRWRWTDKLAGTLIWPGGLPVVAVAALLGVPTNLCKPPHIGCTPVAQAQLVLWLLAAGFAVMVLAQVAVAVWLLRRSQQTAALFADYVALNVRNDYRALIECGADDNEATRSILDSYANAVSDPDDGPLVWLALAFTQSKVGRLDRTVADRALQIIDNGDGMTRWKRQGGAATARRDSELAKVRAQLTGPQPPRRRLRSPWQGWS